VCVCVRSCSCVQACACTRRRTRRRRRAWARGHVHGGGRVYIGERACLRFDSVLNLPIGEREGGLKGCLFAGNDMIAELGEEAFKRLFCTLWGRIGKRGGKGWERGVKTRKGAPFRRRPYSASRLVVFARLYVRQLSTSRCFALLRRKEHLLAHSLASRAVSKRQKKGQTFSILTTQASGSRYKGNFIRKTERRRRKLG
jgi:hypothetical protein